MERGTLLTFLATCQKYIGATVVVQKSDSVSSYKRNDDIIALIALEAIHIETSIITFHTWVFFVG